MLLAAERKLKEVSKKFSTEALTEKYGSQAVEAMNHLADELWLHLKCYSVMFGRDALKIIEARMVVKEVKDEYEALESQAQGELLDSIENWPLEKIRAQAAANGKKVVAA
jgi:hypothetical protein